MRRDFALSPTGVEFVIGSVLVGALFGAVVGGTLADRFGRRRVIIAAAALFVAGALGTALAPTLAWLVAGRLVVGIAIGIASFTTPLYISEVSPVASRGSLVSLNQVALTAGIVLSYLVDYALAGAHAWRWMFGLAAVPAALLGIGMAWLPPSPRWLLSRGGSDQAQAALRRIRGSSDVSAELADIRTSLSGQRGGWADLAAPALRAPLLVGIGLAVFQQVTGINTVIYYAPMIFQFAGFHSDSVSILATVGVGVVNVVMTLLALLLVDRAGRRPLLLVGLAGMVAGLAMLGLAFALPQWSGSLGWIAAASLSLYVGAFAIGLGPVFWLLIAEIYPLKIRGVAMSVATSANWGANLVVALTFLTMVQFAGRAATFWIYATLGVCAWLFVWFWVPETRGRSLEQIEAHWRLGKHPRAMG